MKKVHNIWETEVPFDCPKYDLQLEHEGLIWCIFSNLFLYCLSNENNMDK